MAQSSMTAKVCQYIDDNTHTSKHRGDVYVKNEGGRLYLFKAGQTIIHKHYGNPYWVEAQIHVVKVGVNKYELPTRPIV